MSTAVCANDTLLGRFFDHVQATPDRTLYTFVRDGAAPETVTYRGLHERVLALAHRVRELADPGERALLLCPSGLEFITAFLGCLAAGMVAVPAQLPRRNRPSERLQHIVADADPRLVLTANGTRCSCGKVPALASAGDRIFLAVDDLDEPDTCDLTWTLPEPQAIAFLQYTSGSTGHPRGVVVTHGNIAHNEAAIQAEFGHTRDSIGCLWLPLYHDMGLIGGALQPLFAGFHTVLLSPESFVQQPVAWLRAIGKCRATTAGAPNFAFDFCVARVTEEQKRTLDLGSVKVLFNGAEPIRAETLNRFTRAFARCGLRPNAVYPCYGLAESTLLVSGGPRQQRPRHLWVDSDNLESREVRLVQASHPRSRCLVSSGRPTAGTRVAIVDPESRAELPRGRVGEIWVSSRSNCRGYWNKPAETRETFDAVLNGRENGHSFLRTGDLGFLEAGYLFVVGRIKDLIIIRGRNIYPQDVEAAAQRHLHCLGRNCCAAFGTPVQGEERLTLVVGATRAMAGAVRRLQQGNGSQEVPHEMRQLVARLQSAIAEEFAVAVDCITFVRPGTFPCTSSGKVRRQACRDRLSAGTLDTLLQWKAGEFCLPETQRGGNGRDRQESSGPELRKLVVHVVTDYFQRHNGVAPGPIGLQTSLLTLGIDSLGASAIALEMEKATGRRLSPDIVFVYPTVDELAAYLEQQGSLSPSGAAADAQAAPVAGARWPRHAVGFLRNLAERNRPVAALKKQGQYFFETPIARFDASTCEVDGRELLMLSSFSYLGLIGHPEVNRAAIDAIETYGGGAHGARLIAGTTPLHQELEARLARFMQSDAALVFGTGYVANLATIQALVGKHDYVVGDQWNHASIADGCAFSGAEFAVYKHEDMEDLQRCLKGSRGRATLVVVDAVHSMEGDIAPLPDIVRLCRRYDALLMVDEAHSLGVLGRTGRGVQEHFGLPPDAIDVKMGTLSKGLASQGGFVAGREEIVTYLKYNARGFVFSTAPPAPSMAAALKALEILQREPQRVEILRRNATRLRDGLRAVGLRTTHTQTPIIPVLCETTEKTLAMTATCRENGLFVVPVFYPVVPMDSPRIRLNVTAAHSDEQIDKAIEVLARAGRDAGLIP